MRETRTIPLTYGFIAIVDDEDYDRVNRYKWYVMNRNSSTHRTLYAARGYSDEKSRKRIIYMHRYVNNTPAGGHTDHINGNGLDNRKANLRTCTRAENHQNSRKCRTATSSVYKGVNKHTRSGRWAAQIKIGRIQTWIGYFPSEEDAGHAYNAAAIKHFGEFACLNEIAEINHA